LEGYTIEEKLPGIFRIPVPLTGNPLKELNCYVFKKNGRPGNRNLLIDTGFKWDICFNAILEGLKELDVDLDETDILITHLHGDHIGNCFRLQHPGCKVYFGRLERDYLMERTGGNSYYTSLESSFDRLRDNGVAEDILQIMGDTFIQNLASEKCLDVEFTIFDENYEITAGNYTLKAIHTPGHTPGHMCFEILGQNAMILGDHVLFDITPNITFWPGIEDSLGDYLNSLDKIAKYDVKYPFSAHRHMGDFQGRIAAIKEHHAKRLDECVQIIREYS